MLKAVVISLLVVLSTGCGESHDEVARSASPDRVLEAVVVEGSGALATSALWYDVYVTRAGAPFDSGVFIGRLSYAVRNDRAWGVNLRWENPDSLDVEYLSARNVTLDHTHITLGNRTISIKLLPGITDPTAKPGGMLHNLRRGG